MTKIKIKNIFSIIFIFIFFFQIVLAIDKENIVDSSNNLSDNTYFSTWWTWKETKYFNKNSNSDIVGDYLWWYYYNKNYWFFKLDWSDDKTKNVRIVWSTSKCLNWYWYRFDWYAQSWNWVVSNAGLIDFWYNKDTYVYYCVWDKRLYWKAYSPAIWEIIFDWILLEILPVSLNPTVNNSKDAFFVNNYSNLFYVNFEEKWIKYWAESIFYIWKPKK